VGFALYIPERIPIMTRRGQPKPDASHFHGSGQYVRRIIKCLEKVNALSGYHAYQIFDDWTQLVEACLEALPAHLSSIAQTGQLTEDTPETRQVFERIRSRYEPPPYRSSSSDIWSSFSQALGILLESAEPGLWGPGSYGNFDVGYMGPDVIGHTYMLYATPNQAKAQIFTPWNVALLLGRINIGSGEQQIHERLCDLKHNLSKMTGYASSFSVTRYPSRRPLSVQAT
jgi:hypothetical protein